MTTKCTTNTRWSFAPRPTSLLALCLFLVTLTPCLQAGEPLSSTTNKVTQALFQRLQSKGREQMTNAAEKVATTNPASSTTPVPAQGSTTTNLLVEPILKPGLLLDVVVTAAGRKEIAEIGKRISDDGSISLPLVGTVRVQGMTLKELCAHLQTIYSTYLRSPQVYTEFNLGSPGSLSPWGSVTVLGTVRNPGSINIPQTQDLTVSRAIQGAGGLDASADDSSIRISRRNPDGTIKRITANLHAFGSTGELKHDIKLEACDVVFVPEEFF